MTTLKKSDREAVLGDVLEEAFLSRFAAIRVKLEASARAFLLKKHPRFVQLLSDSGARPYLAVFGCQGATFDEAPGESYIAAEPVYGAAALLPSNRRFLDTSLWSRFKLDVQLTGSSNYTCSDSALLREYKAVWADYAAARAQLYALLQSYKSREKFEADFPEFARYLPPRPVIVNPPAVARENVLRGLAKFGVPAK